MGFHVSCPGTDLLKHLSRGANKFLGAPYAFYIIALATEIDEDVLSWLTRYEMTLDSITGPYAAFMLFYNGATFRAVDMIRKAYPEYRGDPSPHKKVFNVSSKALRKGDDYFHDYMNSTWGPFGSKRGSSFTTRFDPNQRTDYDYLVRSMTYESDSIARELNILDQLPCLVFFDDPSSLEFHLMPLEEPTKSTIQDIRKLVSDFVSRQEDVEYFDLLRRWHEIDDRSREITKTIMRLDRDYGSYVSDHLSDMYGPSREFDVFSALLAARDSLVKGEPKRFRTTLSEFAGLVKQHETIDWKGIRETSNRIASARSLEREIRQTDASAEFPQIQGARTRRKAESILESSGSTEPLSKIAEELNDYCTVQTTETMDAILNSMGSPLSMKQLEEGAGLGQELDRISNRLRELTKPAFSATLKNYRRSKKRQTAIRTFKRTAGGAVDRAPSILNILRTVSEFFS